MEESSKIASPARRAFFRTAGVGAVGAVALSLSETARAAGDDEPGTQASGYRESDHVARFYDSARF